jgi:hypothetical protein
MNPIAAAPFTNGVQIGLRIPVVLLGILGLVLILTAARRIGVGAVILGAIGSVLVVLDQIVNIAWVLTTSSMVLETDSAVGDFNQVNNLFTLADVVLITSAAGLLVFAVFVRRPADRSGQAPAFVPPGYPQQSFPSPGYGPPAAYGPQAGYGPPPASQPDASGPPASYGPPAAYGPQAGYGPPPADS